ncbi:unnamed protein product, partial [Symbiodinium natans]
SFAALSSALGPSVDCLPALLSAARTCESSPVPQQPKAEVAAHALILLELLDEQGSLDSHFEAAFVRRWLHPVCLRLARLRQKAPTGPRQGLWRLNEPLLERQTSLGPGPTSVALQQFAAFMSDAWPSARLSARRVSGPGPVSVEPVSLSLAAWAAAALRRLGAQALSTRGKPSYYGELVDGGATPQQLVPVF